MYEYVYPRNTEKFSAKPVKSVSVKVELKTNKEVKNIYSPTHSVDVIHKDNHNALVSFEEENTKPDIDFKLYYSTDNDDVGLSLLSYKTGNEDGYFLLTAAPSFVINENQIDDKDITFVLDVSGSMAGDKLKQAKKALLYCVNNLISGDGFNIIRFSTEAYCRPIPHGSTREGAGRYSSPPRDQSRATAPAASPKASTARQQSTSSLS